MARKHIMLVCSAGMSTSLLVTKMQKAAAEKEVDVDIFAVGASAVDEHIANNEVDMMLIAPQVRFMTGQLEEKVKGKNIPVDVINMQDYGMVDGENVLQKALDLIDK